MSRWVTITPRQLAEQIGNLDMVSLVGCPGDWNVTVWLLDESVVEGAKSGFVLASDRQPAQARTFKTADAALRVLHSVGVSEFRLNWLAHP